MSDLWLSREVLLLAKGDEVRLCSAERIISRQEVWHKYVEWLQAALLHSSEIDRYWLLEVGNVSTERVTPLKSLRADRTGVRDTEDEYSNKVTTEGGRDKTLVP